MGQILIFTCDNCEKKIEGDPRFACTWIELVGFIGPLQAGQPHQKCFCSFNCMTEFVNAENKRRIEAENGR